ncbi:MAG: hypothetical protein HQL23_07515 [Candidatus Omnitrophica bacterium]|nr:hypothetical protein [Candidatus Omnitrophota bacterium]
MENRLTLDYEAGTTCRPCEPQDIPFDAEALTKAGYHCVVLCQKLKSNVFLSKAGCC